MDRWIGKTAVVTGAASGIGQAITCALLRYGVNVAAIDIMNEKLNELKARKEQQEFPGILETIWCDVSFEEELNRAFEQIETRMKGHYIPPKSCEGIIDAAFDFNLYVASKHATVALTHTVRREIADIKPPIRITSISPGLVKTNIVSRSEKVRNVFEKLSSLQPEDIADAIIYALGTRQEVQITELTIQHTGEFP